VEKAEKEKQQRETNGNQILTGDNFKDDIEYGEYVWPRFKLPAFDDHDEEHREHQPPQIMRELRPQLLLDEIPLRALQLPVAGAGAKLRALEMIRQVVLGVDTQTALLVHVGVSDADADRVDGDVHHDDVQHLQRDADHGHGDDVEAAGADGEGLEETVEEF
jgi:hypothetical protein